MKDIKYQRYGEYEAINGAIANHYADDLDTRDAIIIELKDFCMWLTGCGYDFTQHKYFREQRDKLLKQEKEVK